MHHHLLARPDTVHVGGFSPHLDPVLAVASGDTLDVETFTGFYVCDRAPAAFVPPPLAAICRELRGDRGDRIVSDGPHLLTGPVAVNGAQPGDVLEIRLHRIAPSLPVGFNMVRRGWGVLSDRFNEPRLDFLDLDLERGIAEFPPQSGICVPLRPFFGILAVADRQVRSSVPPGAYGGNLDDRLLQAGSRLFLPVLVPEARFSIGDGHAAQGDGEVNVTAIETSMNGRISLHLHRQDDLKFPIAAPLAETPDEWLVMGFGETLDAALAAAVERAIALLTAGSNVTADDAYLLCSIGVHFQIAQAVNGARKGVRGRLPKSVFPLAATQWIAGAAPLDSLDLGASRPDNRGRDA